jgi:acyl-coenzyme A thioesterase PaaI-like protein
VESAEHLTYTREGAPVSHPPPLPGNDFPGIDGPPGSTGDEPLNRLADALRRISATAVGHSVPDDEMADAADQLVRIADGLERSASVSRRPRFQPSGHPQDFFPMSPMIGFANPIAPPVEVWSVQGEEGWREIRGRVTFGDAYEGPPGCVHGGIIAAVFDEVMGAANILTENPGMTGTLTVRYRRPTPLLAPLEIVARFTGTERRKVFTWAGIYHDGALTAEAEGIFIKADPDQLLDMARADARTAGEQPIDHDLARLIAKNAGS